MDGWSVALLVVSGFVAVMGLVRLMVARRNRLVLELRQQAEGEQNRKQAQDDSKRGHAA